MKSRILCSLLAFALITLSCGKDKNGGDNAFSKGNSSTSDNSVGQFADIKILRYDIPGFEDLTLKEQKLVYYLTQAGLAGRDMMWAQNYRHNLTIRKALENVYTSYDGDKTSEDWKNFEVYLKRVWFSNGIHHHYSTAKLQPDFSKEYLEKLLSDTETTLEGEALEVIFNSKDAKKVNLSKEADIVLESAINFYGPDVTTAEVEAFYAVSYTHLTLPTKA